MSDLKVNLCNNSKDWSEHHYFLKAKSFLYSEIINSTPKTSALYGKLSIRSSTVVPPPHTAALSLKMGVPFGVLQGSVLDPLLFTPYPTPQAQRLLATRTTISCMLTTIFVYFPAIGSSTSLLNLRKCIGSSTLDASEKSEAEPRQEYRISSHKP